MIATRLQGGAFPGMDCAGSGAFPGPDCAESGAFPDPDRVERGAFSGPDHVESRVFPAWPAGVRVPGDIPAGPAGRRAGRR